MAAQETRTSTRAAVDVLEELVGACEDIRVASEECDLGEGFAHAVPFHLWNEFLSRLDAAEQILTRVKGGAK